MKLTQVIVTFYPSGKERALSNSGSGSRFESQCGCSTTEGSYSERAGASGEAIRPQAAR